MRVIAGTAGGIRLRPIPKGDSVRPTLDRVREAVFSILGKRVADARFLDLFAGTGANGIEALSRGAGFALFVDRDRSCVDTIRSNLEKTRLLDRGEIRRFELPGTTDETRAFDIIYADPPYAFSQWPETLATISERGLLHTNGVLIHEHSRKIEPVEGCGSLRLLRTRTYGDCAVSFYELESTLSD